MIPVTCSKCLSRFNAPDGSAGKASKCPNCGTPIAIPAPQTAVATATAPGAGPQPQAAAAPATVTVVVNAPAVPHKPCSLVVVFILWFFLNGLQYFYLGQMGKGAILAVIDAILGLITMFTCGMALVVLVWFWLPWKILWLIDTLIVTAQTKRGPISAWRCFH